MCCDPRPRRTSMKSSRLSECSLNKSERNGSEYLPPSAHCIKTLWKGKSGLKLKLAECMTRLQSWNLGSKRRKLARLEPRMTNKGQHRTVRYVIIRLTDRSQCSDDVVVPVVEPIITALTDGLRKFTAILPLLGCSIDTNVILQLQFF